MKLAKDGRVIPPGIRVEILHRHEVGTRGRQESKKIDLGRTENSLERE